MELNDIEGCSIRQYFRLLKDGFLYISESYKRKFNTNSYIKFLYNEEYCFGQIVYFCKISYCDCSGNKCLCHGNHFAIIKPITIKGSLSAGDIENKIKIDHLYEYSKTTQTYVVCINNLITPCFEVINSSESYVAEPVNKCERE